MLLETLTALNQAGTEALLTTCKLNVTSREVSLVREGRRSYPSLVTLRVKGAPLQLVHLGCDEQLLEKLSARTEDGSDTAGLDLLAGSFLSCLLDNFDDRNPRGDMEPCETGSVTLHTRGLRTFQFRLDTGQGQLFFLAEAPSRAEMAIAKGSDFLTSMESIYLPDNWLGSQGFDDSEAMDNFVAFLRKTESDIYLETPTGDGTATMNSGFLVQSRELGGRPVLILVTDFTEPASGVPAPGSIIKASVGVGDRSMDFDLHYLAPLAHELTPGTELPCAMFSPPSAVTISQRRRAFRVPLSQEVEVELESVSQGSGASAGEIILGQLADLSFSGARIIADHSRLCSCFQKDGRVICRMNFPDRDDSLEVMGVIRRSTAGPAGRNDWQDEIGLEFLISPGGDRTALDYIRQFVLGLQRSKLAQRLQVTGT